VRSDDSCHNNYEGARRAADLRLRPTQRGDQKARNNRTVDTGLRREPRGDGKGHRERESDEADCDSGNQVEQKLVAIVVAQTEYRLRKPSFFEKGTRHLHIIAGAKAVRWAMDAQRSLLSNIYEAIFYENSVKRLKDRH
jgi:hypothetical protein